MCFCVLVCRGGGGCGVFCVLVGQEGLLSS